MLAGRAGGFGRPKPSGHYVTLPDSPTSSRKFMRFGERVFHRALSTFTRRATVSPAWSCSELKRRSEESTVKASEEIRKQEETVVSIYSCSWRNRNPVRHRHTIVTADVSW